MRSIGILSFGKADKLEILDVPRPEISLPGDIIVNVKAVALSPAEGVKLPGYSRLIETVKLPLIIGHDYAGVIDAVGSEVTEYAPGDFVYGMIMAGGAAAEYLLLTGSTKQFSISKMPSNISFVQACGLAIAGQTAIASLLRADAEIPGGLKGKTVFIPAGLSGTGSLLVQVAKNVYGAGKVVTTVSTSKVKLVPELLGEGVVDQIVDYTTQNVVQEIGKETVDFMLDTTFVAMSYIEVMKPTSGVLFTITGKSGQTLKLDYPNIPWLLVKMMDIGDAVFKWRAARWKVKYDHVYVQPLNSDLKMLSGWVEEGKLKPVIGRTEKMLDIEKVRDMTSVAISGKGGIGRFVIDLQ